MNLRVRPDFYGARLEYLHRLNKSFSAYASGWGGRGSYRGHWETDIGAEAGIRWRF